MSLQKILEKAVSNESIIEVFGLGYVGLPLSVRLASSGFKVIGIDNDINRLTRLRNNSLAGSELFLNH